MLPSVLSSQFTTDRTENGQGLVEYGLIMLLVSIAAIVTMGVLGTTVSAMFTTITNAI